LLRCKFCRFNQDANSATEYRLACLRARAFVCRARCSELQPDHGRRPLGFVAQAGPYATDGLVDRLSDGSLPVERRLVMERDGTRAHHVLSQYISQPLSILHRSGPDPKSLPPPRGNKNPQEKTKKKLKKTSTTLYNPHQKMHTVEVICGCWGLGFFSFLRPSFLFAGRAARLGADEWNTKKNFSALVWPRRSAGRCLGAAGRRGAAVTRRPALPTPNLLSQTGAGLIGGDTRSLKPSRGMRCSQSPRRAGRAKRKMKMGHVFRSKGLIMWRV